MRCGKKSKGCRDTDMMQDRRGQEAGDVQDMGIQEAGVQAMAEQGMGVQEAVTRNVEVWDMGVQEVGLQQEGLQNTGGREAAAQATGPQDTLVQNREKNFVSCVVYLHNEGSAVGAFLGQVCQVMQENFEKYEIVCVNDGSTDDTVEQVKAFLGQTSCRPVVSMVHLSFYQGMESAMNAGCDLAVGDFLFEFDRCQMDFAPELILQVYHRALEGNDIVAAAPRYGVPFSSRLFYTVYNWGNRGRVKLRQERFRVISRRAVNRVNQMNTYVPYRKALYQNCGLKTDTILYDNKGTVKWGKSSEEWENRSTLAVDTLIIFTNVMERFSMLVSLVLFGVLLLMFGWIVYSVFSAVRPVEGWMSLMTLISFGFFMLSVMLTLIFKYLSVILNMGFRRQRYVIEGVEKLT